MKYTANHQVWFNAYQSLLEYLKRRGVTLDEIADKFKILPEHEKKGLSIANIKRYKKSVEETRIDVLIRMVAQLERSFGLKLAYNGDVPVINEGGEVVVKEINSNALRTNYVRFDCYYLRSDDQIGTALLQLETAALTNTATSQSYYALFSVIYKQQSKHIGSTLELTGSFTVSRSRSDDKSESFISVQLKSYDVIRHSDIPTTLHFYIRNGELDTIDLMSGTYSTFSRTYSHSVAGLIIAQRRKPERAEPDTIIQEDRNNATLKSAFKSVRTGHGNDIPAWISNYLHQQRIVADAIYNSELENYARSNSFVDTQSIYAGNYVGYYIRMTGIASSFERFKVRIEADGTAEMRTSENALVYQLHFQKIDPRLLIGYLEKEKVEGIASTNSTKNRFKRWSIYSRVMFSFQEIQGSTSDEVLLYGIYGGVEHSNRSPISGRIVLRKISHDEDRLVRPTSRPLDADFFKERDSMFIESNLELKKNIQMYLHGKVLREHTDYLGSIRLAINLPYFIVGDFLCFSIFTEEDNNNKFKIGKYPVSIKYPNTVTLLGRNLQFKGQATYRNNLLVLDLTSESEEDQIRLAFRVRGSQWDHAYGVSIGRRGVNPESRAEVLIRLSEKYINEKYTLESVNIYNESYFDADNQDFYTENLPSKKSLINLSELIEQDKRFKNVVDYLRGEYNRYICVPHSVSDYPFDYDLRVSNERRIPFFAACYIFSTLNNVEIDKSDKIIECINCIKKAHFHGFAMEQNFEDKSKYDEGKLRLIKQYSQEIAEEKIMLRDLKEKTRQETKIYEFLEHLWPSDIE